MSFSTADRILLAQLSSRVYSRLDANRTPIPAGRSVVRQGGTGPAPEFSEDSDPAVLTALGRQKDDLDGFAAGAYVNDAAGEVVISYLSAANSGTTARQALVDSRANQISNLILSGEILDGGACGYLPWLAGEDIKIDVDGSSPYQAHSRSGGIGLHSMATGMRVSAEIEEGKRTILEYLLSPVREVAQEAAGER